MSKQFSRILLVAFGIVLGFVCFVTLDSYAALKFEPTLTLGNVVQGGATILVGLLVAAYFQRLTHADRKEKDILLRHLDLLLDAVGEFEKFKEGGVLTEVTASLKRLAIKCKSVHEILTFLKYPADVLDQVSFEEQIRKLRKLATETPIKQIEAHANKARCSSVVRDGIIELATEKRSLLDTEIQKMKMRILKAQISINKV